MRRAILPGLAAAFLIGGTCLAQPAVPPAAPVKDTIKIVLIGDSTTAVYGGWGPAFCGAHVTGKVACLNLARAGRSTSSFRAEGAWAQALNEIKTPGYLDTYVLVQFGHNDQPGKPGRSTDLATEFPANLAAYIADIRAAGGKPVLVTPLTRRSFKAGKLTDTLEPWAQAVRRVGAETGVPVVDLHTLSMAAVQAMGAAEATRLAPRPPSASALAAAKTGESISEPPATPGAPIKPAVGQDNAAVEPVGQAKQAFDYTHLGPYGAEVFATIVTDDLARAVPALRAFLVQPPR